MKKVFQSICIIYLFTIHFCMAQFKVPDSVAVKMKNKPDSVAIDLLNEYAKNVYLKEFDKAKFIADSTYKWAKKVNYVRGYAKSQEISGLVYYYNGDYNKSAQLFVSSLKLYEQLGDINGQALLCNDMGNMLRKHGDYSGARTYLYRALTFYTKLNDVDGLANTNNNIGVTFEFMGQVDSAIYHYEKGLNYYSSLNSLTGMGYSYDYLGIVYAYKNEFAKSIDYLEKAYKIREQLGEKQSMAVSLVNIGEAYAAMNQFKKAKPYYERSLLLAEEMKFSDLISYNKKMMANCAAGEGDYKAAFDYLNNYIVVNDSLFNLKKNEQLAEIQTKYETEKKAKENIELLQSNDQKELKLAGQRIQIAIMAGILLFGVFGAMLFHNKNKLNQQRILTEEIQKQERLRLKAMIDSQEAERQRIAAELHDGLGQVLSAARVNLAASNQEDGHLKTSLDLIDKSCSDLREISHNMMPSLLKKSGLPAALNEIAERISQSGKINVTIDHDDNFGRLSPEVEIQIFRIAQELLNNILKYAQAKEVQIQLMMEDSIFTMMVEDNGNGFDKEILTSTAGNGWYNIKSRLNLINGEVEIDTRPGSGTVVTIVVPTA